MNNTHLDGEGSGLDIMNEAVNENTLQDIRIKHENLTNLLI